jgi:hypothetical protein
MNRAIDIRLRKLEAACPERQRRVFVIDTQPLFNLAESQHPAVGRQQPTVEFGHQSL